MQHGVTGVFVNQLPHLMFQTGSDAPSQQFTGTKSACGHNGEKADAGLPSDALACSVIVKEPNLDTNAVRGLHAGCPLPRPFLTPSPPLSDPFPTPF